MDCSSPAVPVAWHRRHAVTEPNDATTAALHTLPLATLYLTERCNSRCVSCDYWRHGRRDMSVAEVARLLPQFAVLRTQLILVSGGEPLLNPAWPEIAGLLRGQGLRLWLLSAGLALAKHAQAVAALFESVTVSMDGFDRASYLAIRGVDAFDKVGEGIRALAARGRPPSLRVTVQRANCHALRRFVALAHDLGAARISFLAADVGSSEAFGRRAGGEAASAGAIALRPEDLCALEAAIATLERECGDDFRSGFIEESPAKLHRLLAHGRAVCGLGEFPPVRCNAPEFSVVVEADGRLRPCFFIPGPGEPPGGDLAGALNALNAPPMQQLRADIRARRRSECVRCVCAKWRDPAPTGGSA